MPNFSITNHLVFPSGQDVGGGVAGQGIIGTEATLAEIFKRAGAGEGYVISGFTLPSSGSATQAIPGGIARIGGYLVKGTGTNTVTFDDGQTHIFLQLVFNGAGEVTGVQHVVQASATAPANSIKLGRVTVSGGNVTAQIDHRTQRKLVYGSVLSTGTQKDVGTADWDVSLASNVYTVTFSPAFLRAPIVIPAVIYATSNTVPSFIIHEVVDGSTAKFKTFDNTGATAAWDFSFVAYL